MSDVQVIPAPQRVYVAQHRIMHGETNGTINVWEAGDEVRHPGVLTDAELAALRKASALKLREEVVAAENTADRIAQLERERFELLAKLEALQAPKAEPEPETPTEPAAAKDEQPKKPAAAK